MKTVFFTALLAICISAPTYAQTIICVTNGDFNAISSNIHTNAPPACRRMKGATNEVGFGGDSSLPSAQANAYQAVSMEHMFLQKRKINPE